MIIDADAKTVYLADPEMSLDVGSVGKATPWKWCVRLPRPAPDQRSGERGRQSARHWCKTGRSQWTGGVENPWSSSDVYTSDSMLDGAINMSDMAL